MRFDGSDDMKYNMIYSPAPTRWDDLFKGGGVRDPLGDDLLLYGCDSEMRLSGQTFTSCVYNLPCKDYNIVCIEIGERTYTI